MSAVTTENGWSSTSTPPSVSMARRFINSKQVLFIPVVRRGAPATGAPKWHRGRLLEVGWPHRPVWGHVPWRQHAITGCHSVSWRIMGNNRQEARKKGRRSKNSFCTLSLVAMWWDRLHGTGCLTDPLSIPHMTYEWIRSSSEMTLTGEHRKTKRKTRPTVICPPEFHWTEWARRRASRSPYTVYSIHMKLWLTNRLGYCCAKTQFLLSLNRCSGHWISFVFRSYGIVIWDWGILCSSALTPVNAKTSS
jgi:hypothetical protein